MKQMFPKGLRFRWLTLAEIVGVAALLIAGLGHLDSHRERVQTERDRRAAAAERRGQERLAAQNQSLLLVSQPMDDGARLRLGPADARQVIQIQSLWFPSAVRSSRAETTGNPRLMASWIADGVHKARLKHARLPVVVRTVYVAGGETHTDQSLYRLGFSVKSRLFRPDRIELEGLSIERRAVTGDPQAAANAAWDNDRSRVNP